MSNKTVGYTLRYQRMDRPLADPEALPVGLEVTKDMHRKVVAELSVTKKELAHHIRKAKKENNAELSKSVINLYMEELQNDWQLMVHEWAGVRWLGETPNTQNIPRSKR